MTNRCPEILKLHSYATGTLPEAETACLELHLSLCSDCTQAVDAFEDRTDAFVSLLRKSVGVTVPQVLNEAEYRSTIELICQKRFIESPATPGDFLAPEPGRMQDGGGLQTLALGAYDLLSEIGRGSMGVLYRAVHRRLRREVAVKVLKRGDTPEFVRRVHREMKAAGRVQHPHVVTTTDAGECNGRFFLAMEFIDGFNLSQLIQKAGRLSVPNACEIICQSLQGLAAIHREGLVHRDIKPGNLMLDRSGCVKILDLGLALIKDGSESGSQLTPSDVVMGSYNYIAPEQIDDAHAVDFRADMYGLGATFYTLLAGRPPFDTDKGAGKLERLLAASIGECPGIETIRDDIPPEVATAVSGMMHVDLQRRLVDVAAISNTLEDFRRNADLAGLMETVFR